MLFYCFIHRNVQKCFPINTIICSTSEIMAYMRAQVVLRSSYRLLKRITSHHMITMELTHPDVARKCLRDKLASVGLDKEELRLDWWCIRPLKVQ